MICGKTGVKAGTHDSLRARTDLGQLDFGDNVGSFKVLLCEAEALCNKNFSNLFASTLSTEEGGVINLFNALDSKWQVGQCADNFLDLFNLVVEYTFVLHQDDGIDVEERHQVRSQVCIKILPGCNAH